MLGFLGRFHLSRGFHSLRMCQNHCARQSLGSHPAFLLCNTRMFSPLLFTTFFQLFILKSLCIHKNLTPKKCAERAPVPITQLPTAGTSCMIIAHHQTQEVCVGIMHRAARIAPVFRAISCVCRSISPTLMNHHRSQDTEQLRHRKALVQALYSQSNPYYYIFNLYRFVF